MRISLVRQLAMALAVLAGAAEAWGQSQDLSPLVSELRKVDREGRGHREATRAWAELTSRCRADQLPQLLAAIDGTGPLAANWLRAAVDAVAERELQGGRKLPQAALEKYLAEKQHDQRARRLAYEWIVRNDPSAADRLIPTMLDDPSIELRREAVARLLTTAETATAAKDDALALSTYRKALAAARDLDQVTVVTEALKKAGQLVNLAVHFGFLPDWKLVGPFDNRQGKGFAKVYPPESQVDLEATYSLDAGQIRWALTHTDDAYGFVDLNKAIGKQMGAVAYAAADFLSDRKQPVELRLGSPNAIKIWLNGKQLAGADAYHANVAMDQYVGSGVLEQGKNTILLKICQNEQTEEWAQDWKFQLRVCDSLGKAVLAADRSGESAQQHAAASSKE